MADIKVIGLRVKKKDFDFTSNFVRKNVKHIIKAVPIMSLKGSALLPFEIFRACFEDIQLSRSENVVNSASNMYNQFNTLHDLFSGIVAWCSYMNANDIDFHFSSETTDNSKDKIEFTWTHNIGTQTKNFSTIQYNAFQDSKFSELYNIDIRDLGIISMSLTFEKR